MNTQTAQKLKLSTSSEGLKLSAETLNRFVNAKPPWQQFLRCGPEAWPSDSNTGCYNVPNPAVYHDTAPAQIF